MSQSKLHPEYLRQKALQDAYLARKNKKTDFYNGIYDRWENPVLTRESIPLSWRFDLNPETNPHFMERLGVNAVFNSGPNKLNDKYYIVARIEGNDRKSFFGVAESDSPVEGFHFWEKPILLPDTCPEETNVYDMRLTQHEDGWIYGVFCSESKDNSVNDLSAAVAAAGPYHRHGGHRPDDGPVGADLRPDGGSRTGHPSPRLLARPAHSDPQPVGDGARSRWRGGDRYRHHL